MDLRRLVSMMVLLSSLASCGRGAELSNGGSPEDGRVFLSTGVSEAGEPRDLVSDTRIRLSFDDGMIGASAGCNSMGATYVIEDDTLRVSDAAMTEIGCDEARHAQDDWLFRFLGEGPRVELLDDTLTLRADDTVIELLDRRVADPDEPLVGTRWVLDGLIDDQAASSVPGDVEAWIELTDEATMSLNTGCNRGSATVDIRDATVGISDLTLTRAKCGGARDEVERAMLAVLAGDVVYTIEASHLQLSRGERGLTFAAAR